MGFYQEQLLPRFQDKVMGSKRNRPVRARVCGGRADRELFQAAFVQRRNDVAVARLTELSGEPINGAPHID